MVWLNDRCINRPAPPGFFGGAMCTCPKCSKPAEVLEVLDADIEGGRNLVEPDESLLAQARELTEGVEKNED